MNKTSIVVMGDICPYKGYPELFKTKNTDQIFGNILPVLKESGCVVANLETPITEFETKLEKNGLNFKISQDCLDVLKQANIQAFSLANNHILDYNTDGLKNTLTALNDYNINSFGAGDIATSKKPFTININNKKVSFLSFSEREYNCAVDYGIGANVWDDLTSIFDIGKEKQNCDFLIVLYHGGIEHYQYPSPLLKKRCRAIISAGADAVFCQHSHCIVTREKFEHGEILYGQGNNIFGYRENDSKWNEGLIVKINVTDALNFEYIPIVATPNGIDMPKESEKNNILSEFNFRSEQSKDDKFVCESWKKFCLSKKNHYLPMLFSWNRVLNKFNRISKGLLVKLFTKKNDRMVTKNIIRCVSHQEVVLTILDNED